jgi:Flp pilus assembly protein TadD
LYSSRQRVETAYDLYVRGTTMLRDGHPFQAVTILTRAKQLEPQKGSIREALGRALYRTGAVTKARREFAKAVQLAPADDYAHFALALACERTGQRDRARGHVKLAVTLRPGNGEYERALRRIAG